MASRILFTGLWCLADRCGVLEDRPKKIRAAVFPLDDFTGDQVDAMLAELETNGLIVRYDSPAGRLIFLPAFEKHQNPHRNERSSGLPKPEHSSNYRSAPVITGVVPEKEGTAPAESLILNPDVLNPESPIPGSHPGGNQDDSVLSQEAWEATPVGVMRLWFFHRRGNPGPSETREGILAELQELERLGRDMRVIGNAVQERARDKSEKWFRFRAREVDGKLSRPETPEERGYRLAAKAGALKGGGG